MKKITYSLILFSFLMAGCRSTNISGSWKKEGIVPDRYNKILVLAIIRDEDQVLREKMEKHMIDDLNDLGYMAVSSVHEFGSGAFRNITREQAVEKIRGKGIDAVITIVLLNKQMEKRFYPGHPQFTSGDYYHQDFGSYYSRRQELMYQKGYYIENTHYSWESNFYRVNNQELISSIQTDSFDPVSTEQHAHEYGRVIIKNFIKKEVLKKIKGGQLKAF